VTDGQTDGQTVRQNLSWLIQRSAWLAMLTRCKTYFANTKLITIFLFNERGLYRHGIVYQFHIGLGIQATSSNVNSVNKSSNDKISVSGIEKRIRRGRHYFQTHSNAFSEI